MGLRFVTETCRHRRTNLLVFRTSVFCSKLDYLSFAELKCRNVDSKAYNLSISKKDIIMLHNRRVFSLDLLYDNLKLSFLRSGENQRAVWKIPILSQNSDNKGICSLIYTSLFSP